MDGETDPFKSAQSLWARLWREIYGEPPPLADDPDLLSRVLVESLPPLPPYEIGKRPKRPETSDEESGEPGLTASRAGPSD
jgi:hypothetical protein